MATRLGIYHPPGVLGYGANPFGKDVANLELYRALARHGGFEGLDILSHGPVEPAELRAALGAPEALEVTSGSILNQPLAVRAGTVLRGQPDLYNLGWLR